MIATLATGFIGCEPDNPENTENPEETVKPGDGNEDDKTDPGDEGTPPEEVAPETLRDKICGEWHHVDEEAMTDIYLVILSDGTHELYQKFSGGVHHLFRGTWTLTETVLEGIYNDMTPWLASYNVCISEDKTTLTLTAVQDNESSMVFVRESIPDSVRDTCIVEVKS